MDINERYPYISRRVKNFVNEYGPGRFCKVIRLHGDVYFVNYVKDIPKLNEWFYDGNEIFKNTEANTIEKSHRMLQQQIRTF